MILRRLSEANALLKPVLTLAALAASIYDAAIRMTLPFPGVLVCMYLKTAMP